MVVAIATAVSAEAPEAYASTASSDIQGISVVTNNNTTQTSTGMNVTSVNVTGINPVGMNPAEMNSAEMNATSNDSPVSDNAPGSTAPVQEKPPAAPEKEQAAPASDNAVSGFRPYGTDAWGWGGLGPKGIVDPCACKYSQHGHGAVWSFWNPAPFVPYKSG
jgi:hypothetical protein